MVDDITKITKYPIPEKLTRSRIIDKIPDCIQLECEICLEVINDPVLAKCCGQSFCQHCVQQLLQDKCPHCRHEPLNAEEDMKTFRILNNFKIKCPYYIKCNWVGSKSDLKNHLTVCRHKPTPCPKCNVSRERQNIECHLELECDFRPEKCCYCSEEVAHKNMDVHITSCPLVPLACPNNCSFFSKILRREMKVHLQKCPLQQVKCGFFKFGCNKEMIRKDLGSHNITCMENHLALLAKAVSAKDKAISDLAEAVSERDKKIADLESKIGNLMTELKNKNII